MTCEELLAQYNAQVAAGDTAGADATFAQMQAQGCNNMPETEGPPPNPPIKPN